MEAIAILAAALSATDQLDVSMLCQAEGASGFQHEAPTESVEFAADSTYVIRPMRDDDEAPTIAGSPVGSTHYLTTIGRSQPLLECALYETRVICGTGSMHFEANRANQRFAYVSALTWVWGIGEGDSVLVVGRCTEL